MKPHRMTIDIPAEVILRVTLDYTEGSPGVWGGSPDGWQQADPSEAAVLSCEVLAPQHKPLAAIPIGTLDPAALSADLNAAIENAADDAFEDSIPDVAAPEDPDPVTASDVEEWRARRIA